MSNVSKLNRRDFLKSSATASPSLVVGFFLQGCSIKPPPSRNSNAPVALPLRTKPALPLPQTPGCRSSLTTRLPSGSPNLKWAREFTRLCP